MVDNKQEVYLPLDLSFKAIAHFPGERLEYSGP